MKARRQGDHDGACGFYAIGNAIKLIYPRYNIDNIFKAIFENFFENYADGKHLIGGINRVQLTNVLKGTFDSLDFNVSVSTPFWNSSANSLHEFRKTIVEHLSEEKTSAIVSYDYYKDESNEDDDGHWTVLQRASDKAVYTFDSGHAKSRIGFSEMRIAKEASPHSTRPYLFRSTELFLLKREG